MAERSRRRLISSPASSQSPQSNPPRPVMLPPGHSGFLRIQSMARSMAAPRGTSWPFATMVCASSPPARRGPRRCSRRPWRSPPPRRTRPARRRTSSARGARRRSPGRCPRAASRRRRGASEAQAPVAAELAAGVGLPRVAAGGALDVAGGHCLADSAALGTFLVHTNASRPALKSPPAHRRQHVPRPVKRSRPDASWEDRETIYGWRASILIDPCSHTTKRPKGPPRPLGLKG